MSSGENRIQVAALPLPFFPKSPPTLFYFIPLDEKFCFYILLLKFIKYYHSNNYEKYLKILKRQNQN